MPPIRILLVDDNQTFLDALQRFLPRPALHIVGVATTGDAAVLATARLHPDLILMDIAMPGMNGLEATRQIKAQTDPPCVIILTLHDLPEYQAEAARVGADRWVAKANLDVQLLPAIHALFSGLLLNSSTN